MASVLIADGQSQVRGELRHALVALGHAVVGEAASGEHTLALARSLRPDAVLLDVALATSSSGGGMSGGAFPTARVLAGDRLAAVLLLSHDAEPDLVRQAGEAGALALLRKPTRRDDLEPAIPIAITRFREIVALEARVRDLTERMEARKLVGRAKAILMERHGMSERDAFKRIQTQSQTLNRPPHEIARAIITASEVVLPPVSLSSPEPAAP